MSQVVRLQEILRRRPTMWDGLINLIWGMKLTLTCGVLTVNGR
jgi:hypothetical protein